MPSQSPFSKVDVSAIPDVKEDENEAPSNVKVMDTKKEAANHEEKVAASWTKTTLVEGTGQAAWKGAIATVHLVGREVRADEPEPFDNSHTFGVPHLLNLGTGVPVQGVDRALLTMREGEKAEVVVGPEGGYGFMGDPDYKVKPDATLTYEVELVKLVKEAPWAELSVDERCAARVEMAHERRLRGNTLFGKQQYLRAEQEYEHAGNHLALLCNDQAMLSEEQNKKKDDALVATNLNAAACFLKLDKLKECVEFCEAVLELRPDESKALFRMGQAHAELGNHAEAKKLLLQAETAAAGDEERVLAIRKERQRLQARVNKQKEEQKAAYSRMVHDGRQPTPPPTPVHQAIIDTKWRWAWLHRNYALIMRTMIPGAAMVLLLGPLRWYLGEAIPAGYMMGIMMFVMYGSNYITPDMFETRYDRWVVQKAREKKEFEANQDRYMEWRRWWKRGPRKNKKGGEKRETPWYLAWLFNDSDKFLEPKHPPNEPTRFKQA